MAEKNLDKLLRWLEDSGKFFLADGVAIAENDSSGRGLHLQSGIIRTHDEIISVPSSHQLNFYTVAYHISKFNPSIVIEDVTYPHKSEPLVASDKSETKKSADPRFEAYRILTGDMLLTMSSFQLLCLYILAEWILLPYWGEGNFHSFWEPFFGVFPSKDDLSSIPARWLCDASSNNFSLFETLPQVSQKSGLRISKLLLDDWKIISPVLQQWRILFNEKITPEIDTLYQEFIQIYFIINSRCLYVDIPLKENIEDNLTMVPFVDFLNHAPDTETFCYPEVNRLRKNLCGIGQFSIRCGSHEYSREGEEILLNYGAHSNDFLINEYGFVLDQNQWNYIDATVEVEKMINHSHKQFLMEHDYWGEYTLAHNDISFRTLVALSLIASDDTRKVEKFMLGYVSETVFRPNLNILLKELLEIVIAKSEKNMQLVLATKSADEICRHNVLGIYKGYLHILHHHLEGM